jgi:hypothetical protein
MDHMLFLDVLSVMSFSIMIIPLLNITLNIRYMIWSVYVLLAERHVACHSDDSFIFYKYFIQKKKMGRHKDLKDE